ncbi:MAG: Formate hydrogenlyase transcriptional activator [Myxococcales bacterium]|nr:Formate hydrogenlyase transcriptional activator [Myxococcales bacterium]
MTVNGNSVPTHAREVRVILDRIPGLVAIMSTRGEVELVNEQVLAYFGRSLDELKQWGTSDAVHPDDLPGAVTAWQRSVETGAPYEFEHRIRGADGVYRWFQSRGNPLRDAEGRIVCWYNLLTDIEERKQTETHLRRSEGFLLEAQRMSHTGSWRHNLVTGELTVSPEVLRIRGVGPDFKPGSIDFFWETMHPDDLPRVRLTYAAAQRDKGDFDAHYRLLLPNGTIKHMHTVGHPVLSTTGEVLEYAGTGIEMTEEVETRLELEVALEEIQRLRDRLQDENLALREEVTKASMFEEIVGSSPALQATLTNITMVAPTDSTVMIAGETGTGKELVARAIHKRSRRADRAFVGVNCAAIPVGLIASELFGHERGAFTGAAQLRRGRFELAHQGTIFLDEIGEVPAETQLALLRVLQERQIERVGGGDPIPVDVRVIAATNCDLSAAVAAGTFRADLYYRLNVFPLDVPPLRQRQDDIPLLVEYFVKRFAEKMKKRIRRVDERALERCRAYPWPGNIRELQNIVERAVILCTGDTLAVDEAWLSGRAPESEVLPEALRDQQKVFIEAALSRSQGKVAGADGAAAQLGIPASTLESKIRQLKIEKGRYSRSSR